MTSDSDLELLRWLAAMPTITGLSEEGRQLRRFAEDYLRKTRMDRDYKGDKNTQFVKLLAELTINEGDSVRFVNLNHDFGGPNATIFVARNFCPERQFFGDSVFECLQKATDDRKVKEEPCDEPLVVDSSDPRDDSEKAFDAANEILSRTLFIRLHADDPQPYMIPAREEAEWRRKYPDLVIMQTFRPCRGDRR